MDLDDHSDLPTNRVVARHENPDVVPPMTKQGVGQGTVLRFEWAENAVRWGRNDDDWNEVKEQDDPKDEKFKGAPPIHD